MTHQTEPTGSNPTEHAERHHRFRTAIQQIYAHQPATALRALAADRWSRSRRP
jgi:hypothetical protein